MIAHELGAMIANFAMYKALRQGEATQGFLGGVELLDASKDVFQAMPASEAIEPAAHAEVGDGDFLFTEGLDGLGGDLDVSEEGDVAEVF